MNIHDKNHFPVYSAAPSRYKEMVYRRCGQSGLLLPAISLGLWHNFGDSDDLIKGRRILRLAFDQGITHFDLANNYGPPFGAAEENFGKIFVKDFKPYRDELIISTKAGWDMWNGPYGNFGSKKYLIASIDQSLQRMGLDYVDIFYHHRPDRHTPLEETMSALDQIVLQGKALYIGVSQYPPELMQRAIEILHDLGTPCLINQPKYNMIDRWVEDGLLQLLNENGIGSIVFSPLEQGLLTNKYLKGIPSDSRAGKGGPYLKPDHLTDEKINAISQLNNIAKEREQSLAQMSIAWLLKDARVTSVLVGVSKEQQLLDNIASLSRIDFSTEELNLIDQIISELKN
jgi:L-glyceraldehyde 3-phosphate reductase